MFVSLHVWMYVCLHASSINVLNDRIAKYLVKAGYTYNKGRLHLEYYEWTLDKLIASLSTVTWGVPWMVILLNIAKSV